MAAIIGTDEVTALSRHLVMPVITDQVYGTNALWFRWNRANKRQYQGGTHIEAPFIYDTFSAGGPYQGYDTLSTSTNETVKNGSWDWKQHYVPVSFDARTLIRMNTPLAAANEVTLKWEQARMAMANYLGIGLWSAGTNAKDLDGVQTMIDDGGVSASYASLTRAANTYLNSQDDSATATLTWTGLMNMRANCNQGGHFPSIIVSRKEQYNRFLGLGIANQQFPIGPSGHDEQLFSAGFDNAVFEHIPWIVDDKCPDGPNASNSSIFFIDEEPIDIVITGDRDFYMRDFMVPTDQDAMVGYLLWMGNVINRRPQTSGVFRAIAA